MSYSCVDFVDTILNLLGITVPKKYWDNPQGQAELAGVEIQRLQAIEAANKARPATSMDRVMYLVAPIHDQCPVDNEGVVSRDLFVWAKDASEAVKLWREYYEIGGAEGDEDREELEDYQLGMTDKVRVFEVPIMPAAATSVAVAWNQIHEFNATTTQFDIEGD